MKTIILEDGTKVDISEESYKAFQTAAKKTSFEKWQEIVDNQSSVFLNDVSRIMKIERNETAPNNRNVVKTETQAKSILAYAQLIWLRDDVRGGWVPDWTEGSSKYVIYNFQNIIGATTITATCELLAFQTKEIRDQFLTDHKELIQQYFDGLK